MDARENISRQGGNKGLSLSRAHADFDADSCCESKEERERELELLYTARLAFVFDKRYSSLSLSRLIATLREMLLVYARFLVYFE